MCDDDKKKQPSVPTKDSEFSELIRNRQNINEKMQRPEPWPDPPPEEPESKD